jgi:hypothetical protein
MERVLQEHVRCGKLVDDREIADLAPEMREPPADDRLVVFFFAHSNSLR